MNSNYPDDCGINSLYDLPWDEPEPTYCQSCGRGMHISSLDKDKLECDNEDCTATVDLLDSGLDSDW